MESPVGITLDARPTSLVGRDAEIGTVEAMLALPGAEVVSLVGPSGVGKSGIARALAETTQRAGRHVLVVRLGGIAEDELLPDEVVANLPGLSGLATGPAEALWEKYGGAQLLLVLDDHDRLSEVGAFVDELASGYPALRVLATGLRPLRCSGEQVVRVGPFPLPDAGGALSETVAQPAVALFAERAGAADAGFTLTDANVGDVVALCREVGGLPLAIELAAARCSTIPPAVMARQLSAPSGLQLLHDERRSGVEHHSSMERALEWSYGLLHEDRRRLLDQLSVFEGAFGLDAAARVTLPEPASSAEMLDRLSDLVDAHLLHLDPMDPAEPRFSLPRLVRSHASRRLSASGEEGAIRARHARHFQARCHQELVHEEVADVLAALDRAVLDGHVDDMMHAAVAASRTIGPRAQGTARSLQSRVGGAVARLDEHPADPVLLARALIWTATSTTGDSGEVSYGEWTAERVRTAVAAARRTGDRHALLEALVLTVRTLPMTMDAANAFAAAREGLELAREVDDVAMLAKFELYGAMMAQMSGNPAAAAAMAASSLARADEVGDRQTGIHATVLLHRVPPELVPVTPLPDLESLLQECERAQEPRLGHYVLSGLADQALAAGDLEAATRWAYRMLLVTADWRLTEPLAPLVPMVHLVSVAAARGDVEAGLKIRASLARFESAIAVTLPPASFRRFLAAGASLDAAVPPDALAEWTAAGARLTLPQTSDLATDYARGVLAMDHVQSVRRPASPDPLTPRETQVLAEIATGGTNKEIAAALGMSPKTVMHHAMAIYRKLGVRSRAEATAYAVRSGLADT